MHFHICGDEFILFFQFYEATKMYAFHYKHVVLNWIGQRKNKECEVCTE